MIFSELSTFHVVSSTNVRITLCVRASIFKNVEDVEGMTFFKMVCI